MLPGNPEETFGFQHQTHVALGLLQTFIADQPRQGDKIGDRARDFGAIGRRADSLRGRDGLIHPLQHVRE